jgi:hypothetical protein
MVRVQVTEAGMVRVQVTEGPVNTAITAGSIQGEIWEW